MQKGNSLILLLIGILILVGVAGGAFYLGKRTSKSPVNNITSNSSVNASTAPEMIVSNFYNSWLDCEKDFDQYSLKMDRVPEDISQRREECIKKLRADYTIIQTENPTGSSMWCAQNLPHKVEVDKAEISGQTAIVLSHHLFEYSGDNQIKVALTLVNNSWKISDITCLRLNSSTADETADWKIYKGANFSFEYPSNWEIETDSVYGTIHDPTTSFKGGDGGESIFYKTDLRFWITQSKETSSQFVSKIQKAYANYIPPEGQQNFQRKTWELNGQTIDVYYDPQGKGTFGWYVVFSNGDTIFRFGPDENDPTLDSIKLKIISSFKFL